VPEGSELDFAVKKMVNAGYTGRDQASVKRHIEELKEHGVAAPPQIPMFYPVTSDRLVISDVIEVVGAETSGEAEFVLLYRQGEWYVGVGSDHTDRKLEAYSVLYSKQVCPNVISAQLWPYRDVVDHWDELVLRSWVWEGHNRIAYQEATLAAMLHPNDLIALTTEVVNGGLEGLVLFSGTVPLLTGGFVFGGRFAAELFDPRRELSLHVDYAVQRLDWFKGSLES
jgi:hypothetical protein